jgi:hypothetical protein
MKKMNNILKMISQMDANANEIKLAQHEVELGLMDDFKSLSIKATDSGSNAGGNVSVWFNKRNELLTELKTSLKNQEDLLRLGDKFKASVKELGLDLPPDVEKRISFAIQWQKELTQIIKELSSFKITGI